MRDLFKVYGVKHYSTYSEKAASIVDRFNRTQKPRIHRVFSEQGHLYLKLKMLADLLKEYNNIVHSMTDMEPQQVDDTRIITIVKQKLIMAHTSTNVNATVSKSSTTKGKL